MKSSERVVLITGCSTGIGRAIAEEFNRNKFTVYATARNIESISSFLKRGIHIQSLDVNEGESINKILARIESEQGRLDILVNNAGYAAMGPLLDLPLQELRQQFETSVFAPVDLIRKAFFLMNKNRAGLIVNIGSVSGVFTTPFAGAYCAAKAALHSLSDALRIELAPFNIRVVTVQPGAIRSNFGSTAETRVVQTVQPNSIYWPVMDSIRRIATASQENPTSAETFASRLVATLLKRKSKSIVRLGKASRLLPFIKSILPHRVLDSLLSRRFKLYHLGRRTR